MSEVPLYSGVCCLSVVAEKVPWIRQKEQRRLTVEGFSLFGTVISRKVVSTTYISSLSPPIQFFHAHPPWSRLTSLSTFSVSDRGLSPGVLELVYSSLSNRISFPPPTLCSARTALQGHQRLALHIQPSTGMFLCPNACAKPLLVHPPTMPYTSHVAPWHSSAACPMLSQKLHFRFLTSCVHLNQWVGGERPGSRRC